MDGLLGNAITFFIIYGFSVATAFNTFQISYPSAKTVRIKSPVLYNVLVFPCGLLVKKSKKERKLMPIELFLCICNQVTAIGAVILQLLPVMPCEEVAFKLHGRYRGFSFSVDTYNQKIPMFLIIILFLMVFLLYLGSILVLLIRDSEGRKKLSRGLHVGLLAGIGVLCLLLLGVILYFVYLLCK